MSNAGDQRAVRKAKQRERVEREQELRDLRHVMETVQGRRCIWRILGHAGCFRQSFVPGEPDSTTFNEGRRSLGLMLMADIHELDPTFYLRMAQEARDTEKRKSDVTEEKPITEESEDA